MTYTKKKMKDLHTEGKNMKSIVIAVLVFSTGCATLQSRKQVDPVVLKDLVCTGRESEAKEYMIQKGYRFSDIIERVERARKECGMR